MSVFEEAAQALDMEIAHMRALQAELGPGIVDLDRLERLARLAARLRAPASSMDIERVHRDVMKLSRKHRS